MPRWLANLVAWWSPTAALVKDVERLRWELTQQATVVANLVDIVEEQGRINATQAERIKLLVDRVGWLEQSQVPEFVLTNLRQVRSQLQAMLPPTATTGGSPSTPLATIPPSPTPSGADLWVDGQPPVRVDGDA